eukprot:jgi/Chlat1/946/Chrsp108S01375
MHVRIKMIQQYISAMTYNHAGPVHFNIAKKRTVARLMDTARQIVKRCVPIKCVEAVFAALYLTAGAGNDLDRIPLAFKTRANLNNQASIPCASLTDLFATGPTHTCTRAQQYTHQPPPQLSQSTHTHAGAQAHTTEPSCRDPGLGGRDLGFLTGGDGDVSGGETPPSGSLSQLVEDYKRRYEEAGHRVLAVRIGLPVEHDLHSPRPVCWRHLSLSVPLDTVKWLLTNGQEPLPTRAESASSSTSMIAPTPSLLPEKRAPHTATINTNKINTNNNKPGVIAKARTALTNSQESGVSTSSSSSSASRVVLAKRRRRVSDNSSTGEEKAGGCMNIKNNNNNINKRAVSNANRGNNTNLAKATVTSSSSSSSKVTSVPPVNVVSAPPKKKRKNASRRVSQDSPRCPRLPCATATITATTATPMTGMPRHCESPALVQIKVPSSPLLVAH